MVGSLATSSKKTYAIPTLRAPVPAADQCCPVPHRRCSNTVLSQSLCSSWVLVCTSMFEPSEHLWWEWGLIQNVNSPLLPSSWGFSLALGGGVSPHSCSRVYYLTGVSLILDMGYLFLAAPAKRRCCSWPLTWGISSLPPAAPALRSLCFFFFFFFFFKLASQVAQMIKNLPVLLEIWV